MNPALDSRARFEAWYLNEHGIEYGDFAIDATGEYSKPRIFVAFTAWQAAIASMAAPEGWQLVPVAPTDEMMGAVVSSMDEHLMGKDGAEAQYREDWAAMLRAAPTPQDPPIAALAAKEKT